MWLDDISSLEGNEWGSDQWSEQQSEQQREKSTKALTGINKTRKDESKARRDNDFLHDILFAILTNGKYDTILPFVLPLFEDGVPSNIIIGGFSLVYKPASDIIRRHYISKQSDVIDLVSFPYIPTAIDNEFDEATLDPIIRKRINAWIDDIFSVLSYEPSSILTEKFIRILSGKIKKDITEFMAQILVFFFHAIRIHIKKEQASLYADFIIDEVKRKLNTIPLEKF